MIKKFRFLLVILQFFFLHSFAQHILKARVVSAEENTPLEGATISLNKLNLLSDANGEFNILLPVGKHILWVSYVGKRAKEVSFEMPLSAELLITLEKEDIALDSLVFVSTGYQSIPINRTTGSFSVLNNKQLSRRVSTGIISRLEDEVSGLAFNRRGANPITIRGTNTINSNSSPLIIVDNFPYEGELDNINPNDVEKITVLKDASAAAIWGARAGNGVIVIDTKKGKTKGASELHFNTNYTFGAKPNLYYENRISTAEYIDLERQLFDKDFYVSTEQSIVKGILSPVVEMLIAKRDGKLSAAELQQRLDDLSALDVRTDINDYLLKNAVNQQLSLSLQGGNSQYQYYFSGGV